MLFSDPVSVRHYLASRSRACFFAAVIIGSLPFVFAGIDEIGRIFALVLAAYLGGVAVFSRLRMRRVSSGDKVYENIVAAPAALQARHVRRVLLLAGILVPAILGITAWEIKQYERGQQDTVALLYPWLTEFYLRYGFWPTILGIILLGALFFGSMCWVLSRLTKKSAGREHLFRQRF